jgi:hypothetical protein
VVNRQQLIQAIRRGTDSQVKTLVATYIQDEIDKQQENMKKCSAAFIESKEENLRKSYLQAMGAAHTLKELLSLFTEEKEKNDR